MFTNLDIVWGPNLQVVQDSCPDKSAKVLGCPMSAGNDSNSRKLQSVSCMVSFVFCWNVFF